ncbi:hypothetical protein HUA74_02525 [Myxococcus sp. CA051A]|uniref:hypothetical protein n=1 Tax=Myxococcus sp. CA051A TaxID=2741739 RepID=UPI00157BB49A|nr:hypothetical protein [Myxococcus sp. CA051A]NTX59528.1 hypothetical protein [Myxococcus sp. CA051A]
MDRDLGALDAVSEAMWALQERYCDQDGMPTEVFSGAATMLNGAVRAARQRREVEGADDRVPSALRGPVTPSQVVPDSFRLECSKGTDGQWSVEASSAERGRTDAAANHMLSSAIAEALSTHAKGGAR